MALKQERIIALITIASEQQAELEAIREFSSRMLSYMHELSAPGELRNQILNFSSQIDKFTRLRSDRIRTIETERAYYNPARIKHNNYMRAAQKKYKNKQNYLRDPMDLGIENYDPESHQNNITIHRKPLNNFDEVPLLANIEAEEKTLNLNPNRDLEPDFTPDSEDELKQKFGSDFSPLPDRIGLKRH